jgi:hypothetical protein
MRSIAVAFLLSVANAQSDSQSLAQPTTTSVDEPQTWPYINIAGKLDSQESKNVRVSFRSFGVRFDKRFAPATITQKTPAELLAEDFVEIGTLTLLDSGTRSLTDRAQKEAANFGADVIVLVTANRIGENERHTRGPCARTRRTMVGSRVEMSMLCSGRDASTCSNAPESVPVYEEVCVEWSSFVDKTKFTETVATLYRREPVEAILARADAAFARGEFPTAIAGYTTYLAQNDKNGQAYLFRGHCYQFTKQWEKALADYDCVLALDRRNTAAYLGKGAFYAENGQYDLAIAEFDKAIAVDPKLIVAYRVKGLAYQREGKNAEALQNYRKCLEFLVPDGDPSQIKQIVGLIGQLTKENQ